MRVPLVAGGAVAGAVAALALLSLVWTPHDVTGVNVAARLAPPSGAHWLGTDQLGRDMASMLIAGARTSIAVALIAVGIGIALASPSASGRRRTAGPGSTSS